MYKKKKLQRKKLLQSMRNPLASKNFIKLFFQWMVLSQDEILFLPCFADIALTIVHHYKGIFCCYSGSIMW